MKIPFPRYTRKESLACKLSDEDIACIRSKYKQGYTNKQLADLYGVSYETIRRWVDEKFRQKSLAINRLRNKMHKLSPEYKSRKYKEWKARKRILKPEFVKWKAHKDMACPYRKSEKYKKYHREYEKKRYRKETK